ncbi:hypothetical protein [Neobacillus vireti]|uniref:Phage protein n=1 Tax=Neobacillus vireti LMG 21834 TaxID=1131730 RepID=A0AB94IM32_9BACI|nr:hypothetical protein [Neobacillus vireti]ETI68135.1 hypothetical protein BAVI_14069 [Neobacillus vireti LMG 21834]KLT15906.1 hypothetical protein AA980_22190 [Neobacillus vireti]
MNIYEALKNVEYKKKLYFEWKHNIRFVQTLPVKTEEEFLRMIGAKTLNGFIKWERSQEYKNLLLLLLESRVANDFDIIYKVVSEKAKDGDEKSIRLFLSMQKDIQVNAKLAAKTFNVVEDDSEDDDGLVLD